ncbi:hypothetical protein H7169_02545 [Candidatus Gracilibacteria bacterium]|nr:hypothetical protein [Candidatus Gracilibacteria bacterium]
MTSEEKLDAVYIMLKDNQARMSRAFWYRILKWILILGIVYFTFTHPGYVAGKITEYIQPIVIEQMKTIMNNEKNGLLDQLKKIMPSSNQKMSAPQN